MTGLGCAVNLVKLRMADSAGEKLNQHLVGGRVGKFHFVDNQGFVRFDEYSCFGLGGHKFFPLFDLTSDSPIHSLRLRMWLLIEL